MTYRECAIVEAYTGFCMLTGKERKYLYEYLEEIMGRPVYTHELAVDDVCKEIRNKSKPDFLELCATAKEDDNK